MHSFQTIPLPPIPDFFLSDHSTIQQLDLIENTWQRNGTPPHPEHNYYSTISQITFSNSYPQRGKTMSPCHSTRMSNYQLLIYPTSTLWSHTTTRKQKKLHKDTIQCTATTQLVNEIIRATEMRLSWVK